MDITSRSLLIFALVHIAAYAVFGLHCYHCASDKSFSECESDTNELKEGVFSKFAENCSAYINSDKPVCALEIRKSKGVIKKIMRSCSDGKSFAFNSKLPHLQNMKYLNPKTNITICSFHEGVTCVSLCDTNMCNGPEGATTSFNGTSGTMVASGLAVFWGASISLVGMRP